MKRLDLRIWRGKAVSKVIGPQIAFWTCTALTLLILSCSGKDEFTLGNDFTEAGTKLAIVDTFKVRMSTVLVDSMTTSGTGISLVGTYTDSYFGAVSSVGYFTAGFKSFNLDDTFIFDSAVVALVYSGYCYGDTNSLMSVNVYQLDEELVLDDNNYLYNKSHFDYSEKIIGSKSFYPQPHSTDTLFIPVKTFGEHLFSLYKYQDADVSSSELFLKYIKGFAIQAEYGAAIIGFKADANEPLLKFYYHFNTEFTNESNIIIPFGDVSLQFNEILTDFTGSGLAAIDSTGKATPSSETGDLAFMQGLVGLFPKIEFPSLQDITFEKRWRILKAELLLPPLKESYNMFPLPENLCLYQTDKHNNVGNVLSGYDGSTIYSTLEKDDLYNQNTLYTIDITPFVNDGLADGYFNSEDALFLGLLPADLNKTLGRLMVECKNNAVRLKLYYLTY